MYETDETLRERETLRGDDGSVTSLERVFVHASATPPCCSMTRRLFFFLYLQENVHVQNKITRAISLLYYLGLLKLL